jgi:hypothetical protein
LGLSDTEIGSSESLNPTEVNKLNFPTLSFTFFKTTISFSGIIIPLGLSEDELEDLGDITRIDAYEYYDLDDIFILVDKDYLLEEKKSPAYIFSLNFNDLIDDLTLSLSYSEYNRLRFLDYYYEDMGGREYVNELYGYPSIFGGSGRDTSITLGYLFKFGKSSLPDSTFTNQLKAEAVYRHYFGNAEYEKDTLDTTLNYDIDITQIYLNSIILKSFGVDFRFNHNFGYEQFKDDYITINVNLNFDLGSLWTLNVNYSVKNSNIWRYFEREDNPNPRNPFYDIFLAISIWDTKSLTQTFWKIQSLSFNVEHDLAEWEMIFGVNVNFEVDPVFGYILFKPEFSLSIRLLDLESFSGGSDGKGEVDLDFFDRF